MTTRAKSSLTSALEPLPIDPLLPEIAATLLNKGRLVLEAAPGAGKTTRVPLALLPHLEGRILLLEPRRLAARAAAERMAEALGEPVGETIGYRVRGEARTSARTRIEVVTDGVLIRMIQADPDLPGVAAILFDEFHERSLEADLALALALDLKAALRPDLKLLVMSATLGTAFVAALLEDAPILVAHGQNFPVETKWLERPFPRNAPLPELMADLIRQALQVGEGGLLAFLPGEGEIHRTAEALAAVLPKDVLVQKLYGAMPLAEQRAVLAPQGDERRVVLATSIAETSLTVPDIRIVVDSGLARRARYDPGSGLARLVTEPVSRAEADQRRGRAGRIAPGWCFRAWTRGQEGGFPPHRPAEIETADLARLALELAAWGTDRLRFPTTPPAGALAEARALLSDLGALDAKGHITPLGRAMAALPVHPRLAHMLLAAGSGAAPIAALMEERDPLLPGASVDFMLRLATLAGEAGPPARREALTRIRKETERLKRLAPPDRGLSPAACAMLAWPDRIARRRPGQGARFLLANGRGAVLDPADPLAAAEWLVVLESDGQIPEARIRLALATTEAEIRATLAARIITSEDCRFDRETRRIRAVRQDRLGVLILSETPITPKPGALVAALLAAVRALGLAGAGMPAEAQAFAARVEWLKAQGVPLPACDEATLIAELENWLAPWLASCRSVDDLAAIDWLAALSARLTSAERERLEALAPAFFIPPMGRRTPIDYSGAAPTVSVRLQELFGLNDHPRLGPKAQPLRIALLSPAGRPIAVTTDLPGFWVGSYHDVRKDMRGRYPRHPWPEDPASARPMLKAKPRGT